MKPKLVLEAPGGVQGSAQAAFRLLEGSWSALGRLLGRKKIVKEGLGRLLRKFQERFQRSWGPKGSQKGVQSGLKTRSKSDPS